MGSQNPSQSIHTHTAQPSQEWRGTSGVRTQAHTHPNTLARSGGAQPKTEPQHTHAQRTPQPGVAGYKRSGHTSTHRAQKPQPGVAERSRNPSRSTHTHTTHPGGSPSGGCATGAPGLKTGRKAQRHRDAPCGAGRTGGAPCGDIQLGGRENSARHKDFRGGSGPTSCLLAMKRHGPFSSPGHLRDHEPFLFHWDRAIPQPGYPQL